MILWCYSEDNPEQEGEGFSEEESEVSFEEGTYDGRQGEVSYQCEVNTTQSTLSKAKSQEEWVNYASLLEEIWKISKSNPNWRHESILIVTTF